MERWLGDVAGCGCVEHFLQLTDSFSEAFWDKRDGQTRWVWCIKGYQEVLWSCSVSEQHKPRPGPLVTCFILLFQFHASPQERLKGLSCDGSQGCLVPEAETEKI